MQAEAIDPARRTATATAVAAVGRAAARTGVDFSYLLTQAKLESGLATTARAATSSARGLFQFTAGTWLETVRRHGADHGLGWAAQALAGGAANAGATVRATILALRDDPEASALMAGELARDNDAALGGVLGRAAGPTELYLAHFLGPAGAGKFLSALATAPQTAAATLLPAAAAANRGVFFAADGAPRSLAEIHARFAAKFGEGAGGATPASGNALPENTAPAAIDAPAAAARAAYLLLAELGG
ncbi:hypothetical protein IP88_10545 [alpha proteobacterium AAP81b]|nr:hypothetical protein IP88_10545 [alpha proteobacterium AAP81b]